MNVNMVCNGAHKTIKRLSARLIFGDHANLQLAL